VKTLRRIGPLSAGKVTAIILAFWGLIVGLLLALFSETLGGTLFGWHWLVEVIGFTLAYAIGGFVVGVVYAVLYNLVAGWFGGLKIELDE